MHVPVPSGETAAASDPPCGQGEPAFPDSNWWQRALSPEQRTRLSPEQSAQHGSGARPHWATLVEDVLLQAPAAGASGALSAAEDPYAHLVPPLVPFLDAGERQLRQLAAAVADEGVCDLDAVAGQVRHWLGLHLARLAAPTFLAELESARTSGALTGAGGEDRYRDFLRRLGARRGLAEVFDRFPVLARLLAESTMRTVEAVAELLARVAVDRPAWPGTVLPTDPGPLVEVQLGRGDLHQRGRAVAVLGFADGSALVYKPRPVGLLSRFAAVQQWLGRYRPELASRTVRVLQREGYGWVEHVQRAPCRDQEAVHRFYRRLGATLALLYGLDATDLHAENLIAAGEHPVLVDVETLFHPTWIPHTDAGSDPALAFLNRSVVRTALLPVYLLGEHGALDVSGVGGGGEGLNPAEATVLVDAGTDLARLRPGRVRLAAGLNRPWLEGATVDPGDHVACLIEGFRAGYDTVMTHGTHLWDHGGALDGIAQEPIRVLARPSREYSLLLAGAALPHALRDGDSRVAAFAALSQDDRHAHLAAVVPAEIEELYGGDLPLFLSTAGSRDLSTTWGAHLPGALHGSGLDRVTDKLSGLGAADRRAQEWLIRATLATRGDRVMHEEPGPVPCTSRAGTVDASRLLDLARRIGDDLLAVSHRDEWRVNWVGLQTLDERFWSVRAMGADLGEGYCGTALFLAQLGRLTGVQRYLDGAHRSLRGLPRLIEFLRPRPELSVHVGPGGFAGFGGITYALVRLARLLDDDALAACLPGAVELVLTSGEAAPSGVAQGTAGGAAALLAVYQDRGLPAAARGLDRFAQQLDEAREAGPEGFLNGGLGTAWARRKIARFGGDPTTAAALPPPQQITALSWCSGAAGHLLAGLDTDGPPPGSASVDAFVRAAAQRVPSADHSLCHGDLGVVEGLLGAAIAGYDGAPDALAEALTRLVEVIETSQPRCGTPGAVPTPGLLRGTAGIGYGLLRTGFPDEVPSVLLFQGTAGDQRS